MPQRAKETLALRCVSLIAASIVVTSGAFAAGELNARNPQDQQRTEIVTPPTTIAAIDATVVFPANDEAEKTESRPAPRIRIPLNSDQTIIGIASFYDEPQPTASGERYDPSAYTAAAQLAIRDKFGGIRYGRNYQPAYGVGEYEGKKIILKFNDVGPLRPGRKFDLSRAAMAYFGGLDKGLLPGFRVTPLPLGQTYPPGPVTDLQLAALGIGEDDDGLTTAAINANFKLASAGAPAIGEAQVRLLSEVAFNGQPLRSSENVASSCEAMLGYFDVGCEQAATAVASTAGEPRLRPGTYFDEELGVYRAVGAIIEALPRQDRTPVKAAMFQPGTGRLWIIR